MPRRRGGYEKHRGMERAKETNGKGSFSETGKGNSTQFFNSRTPDVFVYLSSERADGASHNQDWEKRAENSSGGQEIADLWSPMAFAMN